MKRFILPVAAAAFTFSGPALAHDHAEMQKCTMMKDGKKMDGMMKKGEDGKMSCQMMDHAGMDHSKMDHSKMPMMMPPAKSPSDEKKPTKEPQ